MTGIFVNISNHPTLPLKRKMEVYCFKPDWRGEGAVEVFLKMHHYKKLTGDAYGAEETSSSINNYEDILFAKNKRKVDPLDGMELYSEVDDTDPENPLTTYKRIDTNATVASPIGQFDFFDYLMRNVDVRVATMLISFVQIEDQIRNRWNN